MIKLRALTRKDLPQTLEWHNNKDIQDLYSGHPFPVNREMEELWYDKVLTSNFPTTVFGVEHIKSELLIGLFILKNISMITRSAELALYIGNEDYKGKGISYKIIEEGLKFGFTNLGLKRIDLKVISTNIAAIKLYKASGFVEEGILRSSVYKNGIYHHQLIMSILDEEYSAKL